MGASVRQAGATGANTFDRARLSQRVFFASIKMRSLIAGKQVHYVGSCHWGVIAISSTFHKRPHMMERQQCLHQTINDLTSASRFENLCGGMETECGDLKQMQNFGHTS